MEGHLLAYAFCFGLWKGASLYKKKKKKKPICKAKRSQTFPVLYTHTGREEHGAMSF